MTHASWEEHAVARTSTPTPAPGRAAVMKAPEVEEEEKLRRGLTTLAALGSLALISGIALGSMYGIGSLVHAVDPSHRFDILYVFHNRIVVLALIGVALLWLVPPYPSALRVRKRLPESRSPADSRTDEGARSR